MQPVYADVAQFLVDGGFGALGDSIFAGEWGEPDAQILTIEGVGTPSDIVDLYEQPVVKILVRGSKEERDVDVYQIAKPISNYLLLRRAKFEINGTGYLSFEEASNLAPLGKDKEERFTYTMNFFTWRNR